MDNKIMLAEERKNFHRALLDKGILSIDGNGIISNADKSNGPSRLIAKGIFNRIMMGLHTDGMVMEKVAGQTSGAKFETVVKGYLESTFPRLQYLRPGKWEILQLGNKSKIKSSSFSQYEHLNYLNELAKANAQLAAALGNDYTVAPDVVVYRHLCEDSEINAPFPVVDKSVANFCDLRKQNGGKPILHASVSAKWTMRSDRAQNSRTEALNLIRNRKGRLPHIMVVTGEPTPSRLASLALGTGDIDCVYHFALYELLETADEDGINEDSRELLHTLVAGKRLKDISDMPLDLSV